MVSTQKLTYSVRATPDGFIASCDKNQKISVFSKTEAKLADGINAAARMYAKDVCQGKSRR